MSVASLRIQPSRVVLRGNLTMSDGEDVLSTTLQGIRDLDKDGNRGKSHKDQELTCGVPQPPRRAMREWR